MENSVHLVNNFNSRFTALVERMDRIEENQRILLSAGQALEAKINALDKRLKRALTLLEVTTDDIRGSDDSPRQSYGDVPNVPVSAEVG